MSLQRKENWKTGNELRPWDKCPPHDFKSHIEEIWTGTHTIKIFVIFCTRCGEIIKESL